MSFNPDQIEHMREMAAMPLESRCYCGWYELGRCHTCPPDKTCADKVAMSCKGCGNEPWLLDGMIRHRKNCPAAAEARELAARLPLGAHVVEWRGMANP